MDSRVEPSSEAPAGPSRFSSLAPRVQVALPFGPHPVLPPPGTLDWLTSAILPHRQELFALRSDGQGGIILLASTDCRDPGPIPCASALHVFHHDSSGKPIWVRSFTPSPRDDGEAAAEAQALATSPSGESFIAGSVRGSVELGGTEVTDGAFLMKLSVDGMPVWARRVGLTTALAPTADGGVVAAHGDRLISYDAQGSPRWGWSPGPGSLLSTVAVAPGGDVVVGARAMLDTSQIQGLLAGLSAEGDERWLREFGGADGAQLTSSAIRDDGSTVFGGDAAGGFPWGQGQVEIPCDATGCHPGTFLIAVDGTGQPLWSRVLHSAPLSGSAGTRVVASTEGALAVLWNDGGGRTELERLSPDGTLVRHDTFPGITPDGTDGSVLRDLAFTSDGALVVGGDFSGVLSFEGAAPLVADNTDVFLMRLRP